LRFGSLLNKASALRLSLTYQLIQAQPVGNKRRATRLNSLIWATKGYFFDEKTTAVAKNQQESSRNRRNPTMKAIGIQEVRQKFNK
jgi:hypothetical protein